MVAICACTTALFIRQKTKVEVLEQNEKKYINDFKEKEEFLKKEALISAKEQLHKERMELDELKRSRQSEFDKARNEIAKKEDEVEGKIQAVVDKEASLDRKYAEIEQKEDSIFYLLNTYLII